MKKGRGPSERTASEDRAGQERQRLDKWLVYARFARTRSLAAALIEEGRVRLNGDRQKNTARPVSVGDVLTLALPHATRVVRVLSVAERRGSFPDAQQLYEDVSAQGEAGGQAQD